MTRPMSHLLRFLVGIVALPAAACGGATEIDGEVTSLVVRGVIKDDGGSPVPGAVVRVAWRPGACGQLSDVAPSDTTTQIGEFETQASEFGLFSQACVRVAAEPPPGLGLIAALVEIAAVPLRQGGLDTLGVRLTLTTR